MKSVPVYDPETETTKFVDSRALTVIVNKKYVKSEYREYFLKREENISFTKLQKRVSQLGGAKPIKNLIDIPKDIYVSDNNKKTKINGVGNVEKPVTKKMRTSPTFGTMPRTSSNTGNTFGVGLSFEEIRNSISNNNTTTPFGSSVPFGNTLTTQSYPIYSFRNSTNPSSSCVTVGNSPRTPSSSTTSSTVLSSSTTTPSSSGVTVRNLPTTTTPSCFTF